MNGTLVGTDSVGSAVINYEDLSDSYTHLYLMSNSSLARLQKASVKNIHIYSGALSAENIYDNYKRLTTISVPSRDFTVSGGEFKVSQEGQTGNYALLRNNQFFLSGDNAKMFINEDEILPAAQYLFQNIRPIILYRLILLV